MPNKTSLKRTLTIDAAPIRTSSSAVVGHHNILSQFIITITISAILIGFIPHVSCSPTPLSNPTENKHDRNKDTTNSNAFIYNPSGYHPDSQQDSSSILSSVHQLSFSDPSLFRYAQPRMHANQFLMSHADVNDANMPKWLTQSYYHDDDGDDINDYVPSNILVNKRFSYYNPGGSSMLSKRKQVAKPPMEVMNEIVNSIYLKR